MFRENRRGRRARGGHDRQTDRQTRAKKENIFFEAVVFPKMGTQKGWAQQQRDNERKRTRKREESFDPVHRCSTRKETRKEDF